MDCCEVYSEEFDRDSALSRAQRYRKRGLDRISREMRTIVVDHGVDGARVLEVGAGIGALSLELLGAGAASAVNVELSRSYREAAMALALEAGLEDRIEMVSGDGRDAVSAMGAFDVVVLNRVVCCYEDGAGLMRVASEAASSLLAVSYPTIHPISKAIFAVGNRFQARRGSSFRAFVHPESTFVEPIRSGLTEVLRRVRPVWTIRAWAGST